MTQRSKRDAQAMRLLRAYEAHRGKYAQAADLECELDEAIAGGPVYDDDGEEAATVLKCLICNTRPAIKDTDMCEPCGIAFDNEHAGQDED